MISRAACCLTWGQARQHVLVHEIIHLVVEEHSNVTEGLNERQVLDLHPVVPWAESTSQSPEAVFSPRRRANNSAVIPFRVRATARMTSSSGLLVFWMIPLSSSCNLTIRAKCAQVQWPSCYSETVDRQGEQNRAALSLTNNRRSDAASSMPRYVVLTLVWTSVQPPRRHRCTPTHLAH